MSVALYIALCPSKKLVADAAIPIFSSLQSNASVAWSCMFDAGHISKDCLDVAADHISYELVSTVAYIVKRCVKLVYF
jgi:hypothetical protein